METTATVTERDWTDDMKHESGHYENLCRSCKKTFVGYKRRFICRKCAIGKNE